MYCAHCVEPCALLGIHTVRAGGLRHNSIMLNGANLFPFFYFDCKAIENGMGKGPGRVQDEDKYF